ncbi:MAG: acetolactate synthase large subunit [Myxococcota bacterium]
MNGAESLVASLVRAGVEVCFTNPGTSEMHFVAALDRVPGMRGVLGLFEGVVTGAADGYGRMAGKPASTLLHLGPGLANGLANLHNAKRAATPIVNIVGDHATDHLRYDAPLTSDIRGFASPVSDWIHTSMSAREVAGDGMRAVAAASRAPGGIATLILPADTAWTEANGLATPIPPEMPVRPAGETIDAVAGVLRSGRRVALLLRGAALRREGLEAAGRLAEKTGARLLCDTFPPRIERGAGIVPVERIPYFAEQATETLKEIDDLILVGSKPPVSFFAYPGKDSWLSPPDCAFHVLAHPHEDGISALEDLASAVGSANAPTLRAERAENLPGPDDALNSFSVGQILGAMLPEGAVVVDDGATSGIGSYMALGTAAPHNYLSLTGGAIGIGLPMAVGAAVACPDDKVVVLEGDGSGMYTAQALWTMARERQDIVSIVFANRSYAILNLEMQRVGADPGKQAQAMLSLDDPAVNWTDLARSMGVEASRATNVSEFKDQLRSAMNTRGPRLIEVMI